MNKTRLKIALLFILFLGVLGLLFADIKPTTVYPDSFTLYARIFRVDDGYIYDNKDSAFQAIGTWNAQRAIDTNIPLSGYNAGLYMAEIVTAIKDDYIIAICLQAGSDPATTDAILASMDNSVQNLTQDVTKVLHHVDLTADGGGAAGNGNGGGAYGGSGYDP